MRGGGAFPLTLERGPGITSLRTSMFVALAGSDLLLRTGTTPAPPPPLPISSSRRHSYRPWRRNWLSTNSSGPSCAALRWLSANWSTVMDRPSASPPAHRKAGRSWCVAAFCIGAGRARQTASAYPPAAACVCRCATNATTDRLGATSDERRRGLWFAASPSWWARASTSRNTHAPVRRASAPRQTTAGLAGSSIRSHCRPYSTG